MIAKMKVIISNERGEYLEKYLREQKSENVVTRISNWSEDAGWYEFTIADGMDLLQIFHAGIHFGVDKFTK